MSNQESNPLPVGVDFLPSNFPSHDRLWVKELKVTDLVKLLIDPSKLLGDEVKLKSPYGISMHILYADCIGGKADTVLVQGIRGTNLLTIRSPLGSAKRFVIDLSRRLILDDYLDDIKPWLPPVTEHDWKYFTDEYKEFLRCGGRDYFMNRDIQVTRVDEDGRLYAHFEICKDDPHHPNPCIQRVMTAHFHHFSMTDEAFLDDVLNTPMDGKHCCRTVHKKGDGGFGNEEDIREKLNFSRHFRDIPLMHLGRSPDTLTEREATDDANELACEMLVARYRAGDPNVTYEQAYAKSYTAE